MAAARSSPTPIADLLHAHFAKPPLGKGGVAAVRREDYGVFLQKIGYFEGSDVKEMDGKGWGVQCRSLGANGSKGVTMRQFRLLYTKWGRSELEDYRKAVGPMADGAAAALRAAEVTKKAAAEAAAEAEAEAEAEAARNRPALSLDIPNSRCALVVLALVLVLVLVLPLLIPPTLARGAARGAARAADGAPRARPSRRRA